MVEAKQTAGYWRLVEESEWSAGPITIPWEFLYRQYEQGAVSLGSTENQKKKWGAYSEAIVVRLDQGPKYAQ